MNSLSATKMFSYVDKIFGITKIVSEPSFDIGKYIIPPESYDYLVTIFKGYRYPLAKNIVESFKQGYNLPILLAEPVDPKGKPIEFTSCIPGFLKKWNGKIGSFVDTSTRGHFVRDINGDIELFKIPEIAFYAFSQTGYLNKIFYEKASSFEYNGKFTKAVSEAYAMLLFKCISSTYPVASNKEDSEILMYMSAVFALQNFFGFTPEKAKAQALTFRGIDKITIMNNCKFYRQPECEELDMSYTAKRKYGEQNGKKVQAYPIDVFVALLTEEFPFIKSGKMEYRNLVARYTTMYGQNAVLAIEHFFSFMTMIKTGCMKVGLYTDMMIDNSVSTYVDEIDKSVLQLA